MVSYTYLRFSTLAPVRRTTHAWMSNERVLLIDSYSVNPEEFLKNYLEKYPSTLQAC
jgi:hypothetical protein